MADDVDITPGVGETIATDEVAGRHFQRVQTGVLRRRQVDTLVTGAGVAYAAGDVIGTAVELVDFARAPFLSGVIEQGFVALDAADANAGRYVAYLFGSNPTTAADGSPFDPSVADLEDYIGSLPIARTRLTPTRQWSDYSADGWDTGGPEIPYLLTGTSLWVVLVCDQDFSGTVGANKFTLGITARLD